MGLFSNLSAAVVVTNQKTPELDKLKSNKPTLPSETKTIVPKYTNMKKTFITKFLNETKIYKNSTSIVSNLIKQVLSHEILFLAKSINESDFYRVNFNDGNCEVLLNNGILWDIYTNENQKYFSYDENFHTDLISPNFTSFELLQDGYLINDLQFNLASPTTLLNFIKNKNNPLETSNKYLIRTGYFVYSGGMLDFDSVHSKNNHHCLAFMQNDTFKNDLSSFLIQAYINNWQVSLVRSDENIISTQAIESIIEETLELYLRKIDKNKANLPTIDELVLTDPNKGLWELHNLNDPGFEQLNTGFKSRNPALDIQAGRVAIDFGTSSTVVAYEQNGIGQLLRIGVHDFYEEIKLQHYENPTILELVDLKNVLSAWQETAYQPNVMWDDVRCSHEALASLRNNDSDPKIVASILTKLKQWALREANGTRVTLTDQEDCEHVLAPLTQRQPIKGQLIEVSDQDPFDPIELYAWFLGLNINWRNRGIFLRYYMSFPVDYPNEIKNKILASFRRGLQRSLPLSLVKQEIFTNTFMVEERASEPAAYAAIALDCLGIEATEAGVAYGVFDFGGGTTDFDFGYYRLPTEEEENTGSELIIEHFGNGGDKFLGGENLLENMAYLTFINNIETCRKHKIVFTKPIDAKPFNGSEMFIDTTQAANTNTLMLISKLRPFLENNLSLEDTPEKISLVNRSNEKQNVDLVIPYSELTQYLKERIEKGIHNFYNSLKNAFQDNIPKEINVLLAGNASRSHIVRGFFALLPEEHELYSLHEKARQQLEKLFSNSPTILAFAPLEGDNKNFNKPTGKTGVALGLLELLPGKSTKVINHAQIAAKGEAPFQHYVGRLIRKKFKSFLPHGAVYQQWHLLGSIQERVFNLYHTQSSIAISDNLVAGDASLHHKLIDFAGNTEGHFAFARCIQPHVIEICSATSLEEVNQSHFENLQQLKLN